MCGGAIIRASTFFMNICLTQPIFAENIEGTKN